MFYALRAILHEDVLVVVVFKPVIEVHDVRVREGLVDLYFIDELTIEKVILSPSIKSPAYFSG